jgi:hypothetical protein
MIATLATNKNSQKNSARDRTRARMPKWAIITYLHIIVGISRLLLGTYQRWIGRLLETATQAMSGYQSGSSDLCPWFSKNRRTGSAIYNQSSQKIMNKSK